MNTTPEPTQNGNAPFGTPFFTWLRGLGITRGSDRWFAGVAGGLAAKAGIDPLIVRGVFIVLAVLGGPGLLLYLAGWLLLPDTSGRIHLEELFRGRASAGVTTAAIIIAVVVVIPAIFGILAPGAGNPLSVWNWGWGWGTWMLPHWLQVLFTIALWLAIIGVAVWWISRIALNHGRKQNAASASDSAPAAAADPAASPAAPAAPAAPSTASFAGSAESASTGGGSAPTSHTTDPSAGTPEPTWEQRLNSWEKNVSDWGDRTSEKASKWGDDVSRKADAWSAQYAAHHDATRLGAGHVVITLALALLAAGSCAIWALTLEAELPFASGFSAALIAAILGATVVLAVSLIVAGIRGRSTGAIGFLSAVGVIALLVTAVFPAGSRFQPFGTMHVAAGQAPGAVVAAGNMNLDLTDLQPNDGDMAVWLGAGRVEVSLPLETQAIVTVRVLAGNINEPGVTGGNTAGPLVSRSLEVNGSTGDSSVAHRGADLPHITIYVLAGTVQLVHQIASVDSSSGATDKAETSRKSIEETQRATAEETQRLTSELDHVQWELTEPGLSAKDRTELEGREADLKIQLDRITQEVGR